MDSCNGHGDFNKSGFCECKDGYMSADCSVLPESLNKAIKNKNYTMTGRAWEFFKIPAGTGKGKSFQFQTDLPVEIFLGMGENNFPTIFEYDWHIKSTKMFKVSTDNFPSIGKNGAIIGIHSVHTEGLATMIKNGLNVTTTGYKEQEQNQFAISEKGVVEVSIGACLVIAFTALFLAFKLINSMRQRKAMATSDEVTEDSASLII